MNKYKNVIIDDKGANFLRQGQMHMYSNNLLEYDKDIKNGELVNIKTQAGEYLGTGFISMQSHISVRILTKDINEEIDDKFFYNRIQKAINYRKEIMADNFTNCRLIYGDADLLPGLVVDRYNDILVTQISSYGLELIKDHIYKMLLVIFHKDNITIDTIYERNDINIRTKEGLEVYKSPYIGNKTTTIISENGLLLHVDVENGQKTGYFLDQKDNRYYVRQIAKGKKVLDCFSHTCGFSLNAALGEAKLAVAVDVSKTALDQGARNAKLNNLTNIKFVVDDVFDYLDNLDDDFDIIILDPPAFTKSRATINKAYNGYKRINKVAMSKLAKGNILITCTCSRFMEQDNFEKMLYEAAKEAHVSFDIIAINGASKDHLLSNDINESSYLKFYVLKITDKKIFNI